MRVREILNKLIKCFRKQEPKRAKVIEFPYKVERQKTIADVEAEITAFGQNIIRHPGMLDIKSIQVRRHKKYRINKKWLKRYGTKVTMKPHMTVYFYGDSIVGHPAAVDKYLKECLER